MKTRGRAEQSLMQQVCPVLLSAGSEPGPKLEKQPKNMADHSMSAWLLLFQAVRLEGEPLRWV